MTFNHWNPNTYTSKILELSLGSEQKIQLLPKYAKKIRLQSKPYLLFSDPIVVIKVWSFKAQNLKKIFHLKSDDTE